MRRAERFFREMMLAGASMGRRRRPQNAEIVFLLALALEHEADDGRLVRTALDGETECQAKGGAR